MKSISLILFVCIVFTKAAFSQDTSFAVSSNGNVGIGTSNPTAKLDVRGDIVTGVNGSGGRLFLAAENNTFEGGQLQLNGSGNYNAWYVDAFREDLRLRSESTTYNQIQMFNNGGGRTDVYIQGNVGIGTLNPTAKLDVRGNIVTGVDGSGGQLYLAAQNSTNEGGELILNGAASFNKWIMDVNSANLRFFTTSSSNNSIQMFNDGTGKADLLVEGEIQTNPTGDANMVPIAYANVNSDGTLNTVATTSNVTFGSHTSGSGNYYFNIADQGIYYTTYTCIVTLNGQPGEVAWGSMGGQLYIGTYNSSGTHADKSFTFVLYKK